MGSSQSKTEDILDTLRDDIKKHLLADTSPTREDLITWVDTIEDLIRDINRPY
jgi:arsenate reductase-like glutaredoxin family protein